MGNRQQLSTDIGWINADEKNVLTDAERKKRIRETAREAETSNDPAEFERAFVAVAKGAQKPKKPEADKK
jgi:hypothetical protein